MSRAIKRRIEHLERNALAPADVPMPSSIWIVAGDGDDASRTLLYVRHKGKLIHAAELPQQTTGDRQEAD